MAVLLPLFLLFAMITHSSASYCVCKDGVSEQILQKAIDYACGAGADCTQIQQNGPCFQPNNVKSHCDFAVNSYYQRKSSSGATCDFSGAAGLTNSAPSTGGSCLSSGSTGTPSTTPPTTGTPSTTTPTGTPSTGTPSTTTPTGNPTTVTPTTGTPTSPTMGNPTTSTGNPSSSSVFPGTTLGPTGSGGLGDQSAGDRLSVRTTALFLLPAVAVLLRV